MGIQHYDAKTGDMLDPRPTTDVYTNSIGDKQYELSNHLGNVLSVITDQKRLNIERGKPVFEARFDDDEIYPFELTEHINRVVDNEQHLVINNDSSYDQQGAYTTISLQGGREYVLNFDISANSLNGDFVVNISNSILENEHIGQGATGHISFNFSVQNDGNYTLSFLTYENAQGTFILDNIEILDVTGLNPAEVAAHSQEMPIFVPSVLSFSDYYPFGMMMPNRNGVTDVSNAYRYGFQGQEMDNEIKGRGNSLNYKYRMHDPRIGRFFAVDPLTAKYPWYTPYQFSGNKVIHAVELEGLEEHVLTQNEDGKYQLSFDWDAKPLPEGEIYFNGSPAKIVELAKRHIKHFNPTAYPEEKLGDINYYRWRYDDFNVRAGLAGKENASAPEYYLNYGDKYIRRFTFETYFKLSSKGKKWLVLARKNLQIEMENRLKQKDGKELELNNSAFQKFAFDSHVPAYINKTGNNLNLGMLALDFLDKTYIALTPDTKDLITPLGIKQAEDIVVEQTKYYDTHRALFVKHLLKYCFYQKEVIKKEVIKRGAQELEKLIRKMIRKSAGL